MIGGIVFFNPPTNEKGVFGEKEMREVPVYGTSRFSLPARVMVRSKKEELHFLEYLMGRIHGKSIIL